MSKPAQEQTTVVTYGFIIRTEDGAVIVGKADGFTTQEQAEVSARLRIDYEESTWLFENLSAEITQTVSTTKAVNTVRA